MEAYCNNRSIASQIRLAENFTSRFIGLMGKKELKDGEALLLKNCSAIHCLFMKIPIDAVYLSADMEVLFIETVVPWRIGKLVKGARHVLELGAGEAKKISIGDQLVFIDFIGNSENC